MPSQFAEKIYRGHVFSDFAVSQVRPGLSRDSVVFILGAPSIETVSTSGMSSYYYVSEVYSSEVSFMHPRLMDRRILAVYFDKSGSVLRTARYGLRDANKVAFASRKTPSFGQDIGILDGPRRLKDWLATFKF